MKGIVIGVTEWLYGCRRLTIQPEEAKDGKPADAFTVDEPQAKIIKVGAIRPMRVVAQEEKEAAEKDVPAPTHPSRRHGPRKDPPRY